MITRFMQIIQNIRELELEDWCRLTFMFGILLIILAKPICFLSEKISIIVYVVGIILFIGAMYVSDKYDS